MEKQLKALFKLQKIDSQIDQIRKMRGELPMEVADLEDEISGLETRLSKFMDEKNNLRNNVIEFKNRIKESEGLILRYNDQLTNIKNNREYEALSKEIEIQELEVQLCNKRINDNEDLIATKDSEIVEIETVLVSRRADLEIKQAELGDIVAETEKEEGQLMGLSDEAAVSVESRLLKAYKRIRGSSRNGLGVVTVQRDACGGCFNQVPPQIQLDLRARKKIIICEHCGRIIVDSDLEPAK